MMLRSLCGLMLLASVVPLAVAQQPPGPIPGSQLRGDPPVPELLWPAVAAERDFPKLLDLQRTARIVRVGPSGAGQAYTSHAHVLVRLPPQSTDGPDADLFRLGYAIGWMEHANGKHAEDTVFGGYAAAFLKGWQAGWQAETDARRVTANAARRPGEPATPQGTGTLFGRFVCDGPRPVPQPLQVPTTVRLQTGEEVSSPDQHWLKTLKLVDETLLVAEDGGVANIIIYISDKRIPAAKVSQAQTEPPAPITVTFANGRFSPRVQAWCGGTRPVQFINDGPVATNFRWNELYHNVNVLVTPKASHLVPESEAVPTKIPSLVKSDIFSWAQPAVLFPCAHHYVAVTDVHGQFQIPSLPEGEWEFVAWHERVGYLPVSDHPKRRFFLRIEPGHNWLPTVHLTGASFAPRE